MISFGLLQAGRTAPQSLLDFHDLDILKITGFVECLSKVSSWSESVMHLAEMSQEWHCILLTPCQEVQWFDLFLY